MKKKISALIGAAAGALNGFFGSGGGIAAVPLLKKYGEEPKTAHAESLAIMLPLSAVSAAVYFINGGGFEGRLLWTILPGLGGAVLGGVLLKKIPVKVLERIFAVILTAAGLRLIAS